MEKPRVNKTKEQILEQVKQNQEARKRKTFVREKLFPFLLEHTESIDDAQILCEALAQTVRMAFNQKMVAMDFKELGIKDAMNPNSEHFKKMAGIVELLGEEKMATALRILDEIPQAIQDKIRAEGKKRKLAELNLEFND